MSAICIIPARGGSKRIPRKNIKDFCGKPIIAYSIEAALESEIFDEVMVSTDDVEVAEVAKRYCAKVPFMRSPKASDDHATTMDVLIEVLAEYGKLGKTFDNLCCLYPCAPFITPEKLSNALEMLINSNKHQIVMPVVAYSYPVQRSFTIDSNMKLEMLFPEYYSSRSQDLTQVYHDAGQFSFMKNSVVNEQTSFFSRYTYPIIVSEMEVQDIDTEEDWHIAEIKYCRNAKK